MYVHSRILCMCILTSLLSEEVGGEGEGQAGSPHGVRVVAGPAAWLEAWICGLPTPLVVLRAGAVHSALLLFPTSCFCSQFFKSGSWTFQVFCILLSRICPKCTCTQLFLSLIVSSYFVAPKDIGPGASFAAKGPGF